MYKYRAYFHKHCRWCGKAYTAKKPHDKDGFHNAACKQAHYRAYKKWVTARPAGAPGRVARGRPKK